MSCRTYSFLNLLFTSSSWCPKGIDGDEKSKRTRRARENRYKKRHHETVETSYRTSFVQNDPFQSPHSFLFHLLGSRWQQSTWNNRCIMSNDLKKKAVKERSQRAAFLKENKWWSTDNSFRQHEMTSFDKSIWIKASAYTFVKKQVDSKNTDGILCVELLTS